MKIYKVSDVLYTSFTQAFLNAGGKKEEIETLDIIENDETFTVCEVETEDSGVKLVFDEQTFDVEFEFDTEPFDAEPEIGIDFPGINVSIKNLVVVTPKGNVPIEEFYSVLRKEQIQDIEDRCQEIAEEEVENDEPDNEPDYDLNGRP